MGLNCIRETPVTFTLVKVKLESVGETEANNIYLRRKNRSQPTVTYINFWGSTDTQNQTAAMRLSIAPSWLKKSLLQYFSA